MREGRGEGGCEGGEGRGGERMGRGEIKEKNTE